MRRIGAAFRDWLLSTVGFIVLAAVVVIVGTAVANALVITQSEERLVERMEQRVVTQARTTAATLRLLDEDSQRAALESPGLGDPGQAILIVSSDGVEVTVAAGPAFEPEPLPVLPGHAELRASIGEPLEVNQPIEFRIAVGAIDDRRLLVVAESTSEIDRTLDDLTRIILLAGATTLAAVVAFTSLIIVLARRSITDSIAVAEAIAAGNLDARTDHRASTRDTRRLAAAIDEMSAALREEAVARNASEERLRGFVANASHELRTPLTTIRAYGELLRRGQLGPAEGRERALDRIESESTRMVHIIDGLLDLALLDREPLGTSSTVDVGAIAQDAVDDARVTAPGREVVLDREAEAFVEGDELRLRQAIGNLVTNARVHGEGRITVVVTSTDEHVVVSVTDEGPGMTAREAAQAFDRFWRADRSRSRQTGGSGLGLSVVAAVVEAHGGSVELATDPGVGSTFTVRLPAMRASRSGAGRE